MQGIPLPQPPNHSASGTQGLFRSVGHHLQGLSSASILQEGTVHAAWDVLWGSTCTWCTSLLSIFHWQKLHHMATPDCPLDGECQQLCARLLLSLHERKGWMMDLGDNQWLQPQMIFGSVDKGRLKSLCLPNFLRNNYVKSDSAIMRLFDIRNSRNKCDLRSQLNPLINKIYLVLSRWSKEYLPGNSASVRSIPRGKQCVWE